MKIGKIFFVMVLVLALTVTGVEAKEWPPFVMVKSPQYVNQGEMFNMTIEVHENSVDLLSLETGINIDNIDNIEYVGYRYGKDVELGMMPRFDGNYLWLTGTFTKNFSKGTFVEVEFRAKKCGYVNFWEDEAKAYTQDMRELGWIDFTIWSSGLEIRCSIKGDLDHDTDVDVDDYRLFIKAYGSHTGDVNYRADADFDSDGDIDIVDFAQFANAYTSYKGPIYTPAPTPTPTPRPPSVIPAGWPTPPMPS